MIKTSYKRDMYNHFLLINEIEDNHEMGFEFQMLLNNNIKGLLRFELRKVDNKNEYCYDITDKNPLIEVYERDNLSYDQIKNLIYEIILSIERGKEYLLSENNFIIQPEYIYINSNAKQQNITLCYIPYYNTNIKEQMNGLIEYLMNKVNYMDEKAVVLIYGLYKLSREENTTFESLKVFIQSQSKSTPEEEKTQEQDKLKIPKDTVKTNHHIQNTQVKLNRTGNQIPIMEEKIQEEKEVVEYPIYIKLLVISIIFLGLIIFFVAFRMNLLTNPRTSKIDITKLMGLTIVLISSILYIVSKILNKNNKQSKIIKVVEYTDKPFEEYEINQVKQQDETVILSEYGTETVILSENTNYKNNTPSILLQSLEPNQYEDIHINNYPFIIGKLKSSVDYVIEDILISRVHAKIDILLRDNRESEFYITDLGSTNGTYINSMVLKGNERELKTGDIISIVKYKYSVKII